MHVLRLASVTIVNLRSIRRETFPLNDFTALIGYNNAGKTNILMGCRWLLSRYSLPVNYFNDPAEPVEVEGLIEGVGETVLGRLDPLQREVLQPFVTNGRLHILRRQRVPGVSPERIEFCGLRVSESNGKVKREWVSGTAGFEEAVATLLPPPIEIWDNALGHDLEGKSPGQAMVSKIIYEILKPLEKRYESTLEQALGALKDVLHMDSDQRAEELVEFDRHANAKLAPMFPSVQIKLHIPTPSLHEVFANASLKVVEEDDGFVRNLDSLGAGSQRTVLMALIRYLAEARKHQSNMGSSRTLLLIDSPELYLHPQAVELVRVSLKNLSREGFQVVFATHSAQMVTDEDVSSSLLIRKNKARGTYMRKRMEDAVRQVVSDAPSQLQMLFSLSNSNELLFADYVLLTEGKTEWRVLPALFEKVTGESFAQIKCALVRQGGVSNTRKSMQVLDAMDMPVRAIVDLDYAFTNASFDGYLDRHDADLEYCKKLFHQLALQERIRLVNGLPVTRHSSVSASSAYAMLASMPDAHRPLRNLHLKLRRQGIWVWTRGAIEEHLGLEGKTEQVWAAFNERLRRTENLQRELPDYHGIEELCAWIREGMTE